MPEERAASTDTVGVQTEVIVKEEPLDSDAVIILDSDDEREDWYVLCFRESD